MYKYVLRQAVMRIALLVSLVHWSHCAGMFSGKHLVDITAEFFHVVVYMAAVSHDHVELAGMQGKVAKDFQPLEHVLHIAPFNAGIEIVAVDAGPEAVAFQNFLDKT